MARAMEGDVAVRGAAAALQEHPEITTESKNIMGVVVPQIESSKVTKSLDQRGYGIMGTSARIDEAAEAYEDLLESIIPAAEVETAMKKMLREIETTKPASTPSSSSSCRNCTTIRSTSSRNSRNRNARRRSA